MDTRKPDPITVDTSRPYIVVTWSDDGAIHLDIGGNVAYDHLIVAGFMVTRQANAAISQAQMQAMAARDGEGGVVPFASIPEALKQRGS